MKRFIIVLFLLCLVKFTQASHIYGGDINYKNIAGNTYEISLILYGDCSGGSYPNLFTSSPVIEIYNNGRKTQNKTRAYHSRQGI
jgi:hypothetical protein